MVLSFRKYFFVFASLCFGLCANAQSKLPHIQWAKSYGGTDLDAAFSIIETQDKGYIISGVSESSDDNVIGHHGTTESIDAWIIKLDSNGVLEWQNSLGGDGDDGGNCIRQTPEGEYIVACRSNSTNGDVTNNNGGFDYWIIKLDENGKIIWKKSYGGSSEDIPRTIEVTSDGGYIIAGSSYSNDKDISGHHGSTDSSDVWIVKLDHSGNMLWQRSLGGSGDDAATGIKESADHGFIIAGYSNSTNGDANDNHGGEDVWILKVDSIGKIKWKRNFGGSGNDYADCINTTSDGGYIIGGFTESTDKDVLHNQGAADFWIIRIDEDGILEWQKTYGGSDYEYVNDIRQTLDGGFIAVGKTSSTDGDITNNKGGDDYWVVKLNSFGALQWQKTLGGSGNDYGYSVVQRSDSSFIIAGLSDSDDSDITDHHFHEDYWIVKLSNAPKQEVNLPNQKTSYSFAYPNPFTLSTKIIVPEGLHSNSVLKVFDLLGREVRSIEVPIGEIHITLNRNGLANGVYVLRLINNNTEVAQANIIIE
jgi:hypothetical protein